MPIKIPFEAADILLPAAGFEKWATIACDQFTSEPEYWREVENEVSDAPSCLRITLPEVYLTEPDVGARIESINRTMNEYLDEGIFKEYKNAMILVERTLADGRTRRGVVGAVRLDSYSFEAGAKPPIRPTEGTVLSRIPPRVKIRENAPLELPHVMLLIDDRERSVIESISSKGLEKLYDFSLMLGGGSLRGWLIPEKEQKRLTDALQALAGDGDEPLLFAVGDGNHSLATAKSCAGDGLALVEIVNIHDPALDFEPIYRVMFGVNPADVVAKAEKAFPSGNRRVSWISAEGEGSFFADGLESKVLQDFIDSYIETHPGAEVDYIHGRDSLEVLAKRENAIGFLFGGITKEELFPYVKQNGPLPRKTFSMGEARDKRYYMEARRIKR
ncbi:MAG: DUF1015 domain-containing protein [Firmicutes bacterium]|nr:DUF1015 domain-containing protein [Bacillota bacterium]